MNAVEIEAAIGAVLETVDFTAHWDVGYAKAVQKAVKAKVGDALVEAYFRPSQFIVEVRAGKTPVRVVLDL